MTLDGISQAGIALLGVTAIWLTQSPSKDRQRFACIFGLLAQPFWFYTTVHAQQWGMVGLCFLYSLSWVRGFYFNWIKAGPADENLQ